MHQHRARKRFGQHFLSDPQVLSRIASTIAAKPDQHVLEIGPGQGVLTDLLLKECRRLDIIEIDRDLVSHLQKKYQNQSKLHIHQADALEFDLATLESTDNSLRVVGNLPYNISTPLLFKLFQQINLIRDMVFLLQKEVVQRLAAPVNDHHYGRLSVMAQYFCHIDMLFLVPPNAFQPPPKVDSAVVQLIPHTEIPVIADDFKTFAMIVKEAFSYRRKTIHNSLKRMVTPEQLERANVDPKLRPQQLSVADYVHISNQFTLE